MSDVNLDISPNLHYTDDVQAFNFELIGKYSLIEKFKLSGDVHYVLIPCLKTHHSVMYWHHNVLASDLRVGYSQNSTTQGS